MWNLIWQNILSGYESEKMEFKETVDLGNKQAKAEFARDISAIANTEGEEGYLVIGVIDQKHRKGDQPEDAIAGFTCADTDELYRQMYDILADYLHPVPRIEVHSNIHPYVKKQVCAVIISKSYARPHWFKRSGVDVESNEVWVRRGVSCHKANPDEIEEMMRQRRRITIVNFTHPLNDIQQKAIEFELNCIIEEEINHQVQFDQSRPFRHQATDAIDHIGLRPRIWQSGDVVVNLPGLSAAAAAVLADLHGRIGHFPPVIRVRSLDQASPVVYEVAEIINLQAIREESRKTRNRPA
jgi:predicted HTH transcriptional regulator